MALNEYKPGTAFPGPIGWTTDQSSPAWPELLRAWYPDLAMTTISSSRRGRPKRGTT